MESSSEKSVRKVGHCLGGLYTVTVRTGGWHFRTMAWYSMQCSVCFHNTDLRCGGGIRVHVRWGSRALLIRPTAAGKKLVLWASRIYPWWFRLFCTEMAVIPGDSGGGYGQSQTQCSQCLYSFIFLSYFLSFPVVNRFSFFLLPLIITSYFIYKAFSTTTLWGRTLWFLESTLHTLLVKRGGQVKLVCSYH